MNTTGSKATAELRVLGAGHGFVSNMWYFAVPASKLKRGTTLAKTMLGEPILLGRDADGTAFAMRDICPHQAVPLSDGHFDGREIACCFHGWKFNTAGECTEIPALCSDQKMNLCAIKTKLYPCREVLGSVWVFFGDSSENLPEVPQAPGLDGYVYDKTTTNLHLPNHVDYNVVALVDTAHVPYVHNAWWWRSSRSAREKRKTFVPKGTGWNMLKHTPPADSIMFKLIGKFIETEIGFRLPGCRIEHISFNGRTILSGITALTPIDEENTELNHTTYWTIPYVAPLITPFINYFVKAFLSQDQSIAIKQQKYLKTKSQPIMMISDSGTTGGWYFLLKREWNEATAQGRAFVNPIKETILRWRT